MPTVELTMITVQIFVHYMCQLPPCADPGPATACRVVFKAFIESMWELPKTVVTDLAEGEK